MEGLIPLLILLGIVLLLSGPVALVVGLVALSRIRQLQRERSVSDAKPLPARPVPAAPARPVAPEKTEPAPMVPERPAVKPIVEMVPPPVPVEPKMPPVRELASLEQRIGTRWVLIAGVVTVICAVGFFLKYAYDNAWIQPQTRVIIAAVAGVLALGLGEVTRRRGYEIVAKGVTALGFAILYATVFAAHRWYALIDSPPAFALAIGVTIGAMLYAVVLDEVVAALLALIGGYLTPVVVSTGQNLPTPLFSYVLILSAGAMLCACWRKWPAVNVLAFIGTFVLYTGWFEKFYRPAMHASDSPEQLGVALLWVVVFFFAYLILPILHGLVRRVASQTADVVLVLANATVVFYYLWTLLGDAHRPWLALCSVGLGLAHLLVMVCVIVRCKGDVNLQQALLAIGLVFLTVAVPLYLKMYAIAITWAVEAVVLTVIALRYRNLLVRIAGMLVLGLAVERLVQEWPMHSEVFRAILNPAFGTWCFVAVAVLVCHVLHRLDLRAGRQAPSLVVEMLYAGGLLLLIAAVSQELWYHNTLNLPLDRDRLFFTRNITLVIPGFLLLLVARPICPRGALCSGLAMVIAVLGSLGTVMAFASIHQSAYTIFLNGDFVRGAVLVATLFVAGWFLQRTQRTEPPVFVPPIAMAMTATVLLWILLTQEIWHFWRCLDRYDTVTTNWRFLAHMCISVMWAVYASSLMVVGFWKRIRLLRYVALAAFALLLGKIFLVDTRNVSSLYRIAGFLATGNALVGVSYLYQYLKKQGFFERMLADE